MLVLCFIYESGVSSCSSLYRPEILPAAQLPAFTQQLSSGVFTAGIDRGTGHR